MEMMNQKLLLQADKLFEAVTQQNELKKSTRIKESGILITFLYLVF